MAGKAIGVPETNRAFSTICGQRRASVGSGMPKAGKQAGAGVVITRRQWPEQLFGRVAACCSFRVGSRARTSFCEAAQQRAGSAGAQQDRQGQARQGGRTRSLPARSARRSGGSTPNCARELGITDQQSAAVEQVWQKSLPDAARGAREARRSSKTVLSQMIAGRRGRSGGDRADRSRRGRPRRVEQGAHADDLPHEQIADAASSARRSRRCSKPRERDGRAAAPAGPVPVSTRFSFHFHRRGGFREEERCRDSGGRADRS